jgi:hypothetical protein
MRGARLDLDDVARPGGDLFAPDLHLHRALEHLEALGLVWMDVGGGDDRARLEDGLDEDVRAVGVARGFMEDEALARDGVLDRLSGPDHW